MSYTMREVMEMLRGNPDIQIDGDEIGRNRGEIIPSIMPLSERELQQAVVDECDRRAITKPAYALLFAIPNGQYRQGQRIEPGVRRGVPDLFMPIPRLHPNGVFYSGLFLELKIGNNQLSAHQREWIERLQGQGYCCHVVRDSLEAVMAVIEGYLEG